MAEWIADSEPALHKMLGDLRQLWHENKYLVVKCASGKKRSLPQNSIQHAWYTQMALEDRQYSKQEHARYCKWTHGLPILCADDPDYRALCRTLLGPLGYEARLIAMDHFPVTRLFTKGQESQYLEAVQQDYGNRGVHLTFPDKSAEAA